MEPWWIGLLIAVPLVAAAIVGAVPARAAVRLAPLASGAALALALATVFLGPRGVWTAGSWVPGLGIDLAFRADALTLALAVLVTGVGTAVLAYASAYFGPSAPGRRALAWLLAFEASMLGLVLADDALLLFVFWELTGVCSYFLIQLEARRSPDAEPAARQALLVTVLGGLPLLVGLLFLQAKLGTASISAWSVGTLDPGSANVAFALVALGALAKSAQFPFHFWLPGAMAAPSPISAYLHSATMVKAGVILLLFLFPVLHTATLWTPVLLSAGAVTCIWGSYRALTESDVKKLMAWSTVSQLGLLVLTLGLGTELAARAAILHLFAHGVFKAGLFLAVGSIDKAAGTRELDRLGGLVRREPVLAAAAIVCAGSMAGLPPLAGFLSKELILKKTMLADPVLHLPALTAIFAASVGTVAYSLRFVLGAFFGRTQDEPAAGAAVTPGKKLGPGLLAAPAVLALVSLVVGTNAAWVDRSFLEPATGALLGHDLEPPKLKLWYGWNLPLFLSIGILLAGFGLHRSVGGRRLPVGEAELAPHRLYHRALDLAAATGAALDRVLTRWDPRLPVVLPLVLGFAAAWPLLGRIPELAGAVDGAGAVVTIGLAGSAVALARSRGRVERIVWSSVLGFGVAVLFRRAHAPDLVLTQLLVEMIVTVVLLLGIRRLGDRGTESALQAGEVGAASSLAEGSRGRPFRREVSGSVLRHAAALVVAGGAASLVLAFPFSVRPGGLSEFYAWAGPKLAEGENLVNVILVDFRGLDTFIETWVVLLAGLGVVALFRDREIAVLDLPAGSLRASGVLLRTVSGFLVPFSALLAFVLLLQGHDDPGGGFVAALVLVLGWVLFALTRGDRGLVGHGEVIRIALAGVSVLLVSALVPLLIGEPALRQAGTKLGAGTPFAWKAHSSLLFDVGVVLTVASAGTAALLALLAGARGARTSGGRR